MNVPSALNRAQKEAIGLLQIGTFLEYFDLMLYVHMAVLLNELFFPRTDPQTAALLTAFAFCSTFVMRPLGALIFGYIGDHMGRKLALVMTTITMAFSCIIVAILPTYAQIGIIAAWIITFCRIIQGMSSLGEIVGAEIYLTEITKQPIRYPIVSLIGCSSSLGTVVALAVATLVTSSGLNWRLAFWMGAIIAVVGYIARIRLQESPEFVRMRQSRHKADKEEKASKTTILAYFLISCAWPVSLYFSYIYCGNILKNIFGYTADQIIQQNLIVSIVQLLCHLLLTYLSYRIPPLKIVRIRIVMFFIFILSCPFFLKALHTPLELLFVQIAGIIFASDGMPAIATFLAHFPILKRFRYISFIYSISRACMHIITSFGIIFLINLFGQLGLWIVMIPVNLAFLWGIFHFQKLEEEA